MLFLRDNGFDVMTKALFQAPVEPFLGDHFHCRATVNATTKLTAKCQSQ